MNSNWTEYSVAWQGKMSPFLTDYRFFIPFHVRSYSVALVSSLVRLQQKLLIYASVEGMGREWYAVSPTVLDNGIESEVSELGQVEFCARSTAAKRESRDPNWGCEGMLTGRIYPNKLSAAVLVLTILTGWSVESVNTAQLSSVVNKSSLRSNRFSLHKVNLPTLCFYSMLLHI
jgi:hypothetical protein